MKIVLLCILLSFCAGIHANVSWKMCDSSQSPHLTVSSVIMDPYPVKIGQNVTTYVNGTIDAALNGGTYKLSVSTFGIVVLTQSGSGCELPISCQCPNCPAGPIMSKLVVATPSYALPGTYQGQFNIYDNSGAPFGCLLMTFESGY